MTHQIQLPLLDTEDREYKLSLFHEDLADDTLYLGANQVEIKEHNIVLPRTLYHLFFLYFALKSGNDKEKYSLLNYAISMDEDLPSLKEHSQERYAQTRNQLHSEIQEFLKEKQLSQLTWKDVKILVEDICNEFETIEQKGSALTQERRSNLWYHFYRFCFYGSQEGPAKFKEMTLRAIALEWGSPCGTEILYRAAQISADDIFKGNKEPHSLSFSPSFFSGLAFEGNPSGTCSYVYYKNLCDKQLYALQLPASKVNKYFFYPALFKSHALLPLVAKGEFSHPRLKIFLADESMKVSGAQGRDEQVKKLAAFVPTAKVQDPATYRNRLIKIFQNSIHLLGS